MERGAVCWRTSFGTRGSQVQILPLRPTLNPIQTNQPDSFPDRNASTSARHLVDHAGDPVGAGLVASLARPGGNVTGLSLQQTDIATKKLELLREAVPGLRRLAILGNVGNASAALRRNFL